MTAKLARTTVTISIQVLFLLSCVARGQNAAVPPPRVPENQDYVGYFENQLANARSDDERITIKRKLTSALMGVADQRVPTGSTSARVRALARVDSLYKELEDHSPGTSPSYQDYFDHAYFLANHGFGELVPFSYYLRRPEPDYPRALELFQRASEAPDLKLREKAKGEMDKILAPVLYIGVVHYADNSLVLAFAVRNLDLVRMKVECQDQPDNTVQSWSVNFAATLDHRVQVHYYRIARVPECRNLVVTASTPAGVSHSLGLSPSDKQEWAGGQDPVNDHQTRRVIEDVFEVSVPQDSHIFRQHHSYNQTCSLCHIPHNAGE